MSSAKAGPAAGTRAAPPVRRSIDWTLSRPGNQRKLGYLLLLPAVLLVLAIIVYPLVLAVDLSLQDVKIARIGMERQGWTLQNYQQLFASAEFWRASWVSSFGAPTGPRGRRCWASSMRVMRRRGSPTAVPSCA